MEAAVLERPPAPAGRPSSLVDTRVIYGGDNLDKLRNLPDACVDLIYIDPPFNSNRNYEVFWGETREKRAFEDRHASAEAYIDFMRPRCIELHRVLKETGTYYQHCDWHASHLIRIMLDQLFGANSFRTEIIWKRTNSKGLAFRSFANNHDTIFCYTKSDRFTFNRLYRPLVEQYVEEFYKHREPETGRRYALDNLINPNRDRPNLTYEFLGVKRVWRWTRARMQKAYDDGLIVQSKPGAVPRLKRYLDEQEGIPVDSVWTDIPPIASQSAERLGYPTQKPLALLDRIIKASSDPNDIVLDAFCGCGTTLAAAQNLGRQWIGIDISPTACRVMAKRLQEVCRLREDEALWRAGRGFVVRNLLWTEDMLRRIPPFEFQNWAVNALGGVPNKTKVGDMGIDGRIYPVSALPEKTAAEVGELAFMDNGYPVQVKQKDRVGRPDIDAYEAVMMRIKPTKGFIIGFGFSSDAMTEISRFFKRTGKVIAPLTVREILDEDIAPKLV